MHAPIGRWSSERRRRRFATIAALVTVASSLSCLDNTGLEIPRPGQLAFAPMFSSAFSGVVDVDSARVVLLRLADSAVVTDTTVSIDGDSVDLTFPVVVLQEPALFVVTMDITGPGGAVLFQAGPDTVLATVGPTAGAVPPPIVIDYVGPGSNAATFTILTADTTLFSTEALQIIGEARDPGGSVTPAPVGWTSLDTTIATVGKGTGLAVAGSIPGTVGIVGALLTDVPPDTVFVTVRPLPTSMVVASGDGQLGSANSTLPSSIVFQVSGTGGRPVPGITVSFAPSAGTVSQPSGVTDAGGNVSVTWTMPSTTGPVTLAATLDDFPTIQTTATATVTAGAATDLAIVSGDRQTGTVGTPLTDSLVVEATDQFGNPVPGAAVNWTVTTNDGVVNPLPSTADANGRASVEWTLGTVVGANAVVASLPGVPIVAAPQADSATAGASSAPTVAFTATGTAGSPAIMSKVSGEGQSATVGTTLPAPIVVDITDRFGNLIAGVEITFTVTSGGGSVANSIATTDGLGQARATWTLGTPAAGQTLEATSPGVTLELFNATGIPDSPSAVAFVVEPSDAAANATITPPVEVEILDQYGNRVTQDNTANVDIAITSGTGNPSAALAGTLTRTATSGLVVFNDLSIDSAGTGYTLNAQIPSLALATSATFAISGPATTPLTWIGAVDTDWFNPANWTPAAVPTSTDSVLIRASAPNQPRTSGAPDKTLSNRTNPLAPMDRNRAPAAHSCHEQSGNSRVRLQVCMIRFRYLQSLGACSDKA